MEFPKWKKDLQRIRSTIERLSQYSKRVILSAGLLSLASGSSVGQPRVPVDPKLSTREEEVSKYFGKYVLRSVARPFASLFAQHRSHSSHSSHTSHYSGSGSGHSSHSSHASHYSASAPSETAVRPAPTSPRVVLPSTTRARTTTSRTVFSDTFADVYRVRTKWRLGLLTARRPFTDSQIPVAQQNGRLEVRPRATLSQRSFNGYVSATAWNFTAAHARVEILQTTEGTADTVFAIGTDSENWYGFVVEDGKLYLQSKINGRKVSENIPYDPAGHRFWRLRHEANDNEILWETSADGEVWTVLRKATPQIPLTALYITLGAGTYTAETEPGVAAFGDFKLVIHR